MAPRKPAKKPIKASAKKAVTPAKKVVAKPVTVPQTEAASCCSTSKSCCLVFDACPLAKRLVTRSFWASAVVAFLIIFATDWFVHGRLLMSDYMATSAFWRTETDMRHGLLLTSQALTAMVYAVIVLSMGYANRWWGSMVSGILAAAPLSIATMATYATMPFASAAIPATWAVTSIAQGALVGLAICAMLKAARAPETNSCGCGPDCSCKA